MTSVFARQKLRAQELQILKDNIRKKLPVLNKAQIRRHRIPYHEALYLELQEEGFAESANFLRSLIEYQDAIRNKAEPESLVWSKPLLKDHPEMIDELYNGIKSAEKAFQNNLFGEQCDSLLKLGIFYSNQSDVWWWLAEQIFVKAVNCVCCYNLDGGKRHAFSRYLYGRYLLLQAKNAERANDQLRICRELSIGRRWSTQEILQIPQSILYIECCSLLYKALLIIAREIKQDDPLKAFKICTIAQKRAIDAQDKTGEADCLMELALCKMKARDIKNSLSWFNKVLRMQNTLNNGVGVCETHIQLAFAYSSLGNVIEAKQHLTLLLKYSKEHSLKYFYGQALRHLGEFHLNHAHPNEATKYLIEALQVFHELDDYDNREQVKNLAAISAGQELLGEYRKLIQGCNKTKLGQINIEKIISWKDKREEFWDKKCNLKMHASVASMIIHQNNFLKENVVAIM
ncbi:hypothetical protein CBL_01862 [Carabus blaptoides fortunei]